MGMHKRFILAIVLVCSLTFANSLLNGFVGDDEVLIINNSFYKDFNNFPRLFQRNHITESLDVYNKGTGDFGSGAVSYRPLAVASFFFGWLFWGSNPAGYHLINFCLHLGNSILLYFLVFLLTRARPAALLSALLFCVHPLKAEPVCAIGYRHDAMACFFSLAALLSFVIYRQRQVPHSKKFFPLAVLSIFLAVFSKESAVIMPAVILLYDRYFHRVEIKKSIVEYAWILAVWLFYLYTYFFLFPNSTLGANPFSGAAFGDQVGMSLRILGGYFYWLVNPFGVTVFPPLYAPPIEPLSGARTIGGGAALGLLLGLIWYFYRREKAVSFFLAFFLIALLPVLNIIHLANPMAQRFLYLPSVGFLSAVGIFLACFVFNRDIFARHSRLRMILAGFLIAACAVCTIYLNSLWRSNFTFASALVKEFPRDPKGYSILGIVYFRAGLCQQAEAVLKKSLSLGLADPRAYYMLGVCARGGAEESRRYFETAIALAPEYAAPYLGLGKLLFWSGEYRNAAAYFERVTELDPGVSGYFYLLQAYLKLSDHRKAAVVLERARRQIKDPQKILILEKALTSESKEAP